MYYKRALQLPQFRQISYKKLISWYSGLVKPKPNDPPFDHIIQIGDPSLRAAADKIPEEYITSPEIKLFIRQMEQVFKKYKCVGLSANQIGMPLQLFMLEFNKNHAKIYTEKERETFEMTLLPFTIIINPEMKIVDYTKLVFPEACASVKGFFADVPRYRAIELKGLDENGTQIHIKASGWIARIIQHEIDHLNGQMYIDIMNRKTFTCSCWNVINERRGRVDLPYGAE